MRALSLVLAVTVSGVACRSGAATGEPSTAEAKSMATATNASATTTKPEPETAPAANTPGNFLRQKKLYSQNNEELIIRDFFQDRRNGFFLDVGCAWPKRNSTTYYLEKHLGWSGIGIDALSDYGPDWAKWRPKSKFFVFLVGDKSDTMSPFYKAEWTGVSSTKKNRTVMGKKVKAQEIRVRAITLNKLLDDNKVGKVDFLSMDIEGAEPKALAGFDIKRFKPELVCIESTPSIRLQILAYFSKHGYERIEKYRKHDFVNWYFKPRKY